MPHRIPVWQRRLDQRLALMRDQRDPLARQLLRRGDPRDRHREHRPRSPARPSARRSAQPGQAPRSPRRPPRCQRRAHVARVRDAHSARHTGPAGRVKRCSCAERPGAEPSALTATSASGATSTPSRPLPAAQCTSKPAAASAAASGPRPRPRRPARSRAAALGLRISASGGCGGSDHKARPPCGVAPGGSTSVGLVLSRPTSQARSASVGRCRGRGRRCRPASCGPPRCRPASSRA